MIKSYCVGVFNPAEIPIQIAVSTLSPVIIQMFMPALLSELRNTFLDILL